MSRKDLFHNHVKHILEHEGWTISDDPLYLSFGNVNVQIDLAAEQIIAAEKEDQKIAVEVKSFSRTSKITEFYSCLGQYLTYKVALLLREPQRPLYLAVPAIIYDSLFQEYLVVEVLKRYPIKLIVYNPENQESALWIE